MNDDRPKGSKLWHHMAETHNIHLLVSEEADIRHAVEADGLRDYFAAKALQGMIGGEEPMQAVKKMTEYAAASYVVADAMLEIRGLPPK